MVRAAYSSGTPAYGVGAGNSTMIIDETANIEEAARNTRLSKTSTSARAARPTATDHRGVDLRQAARDSCRRKAAISRTTRQKAAAAKAMWDDERHRQPGHGAHRAAAAREGAGFTIPADRKFIIVHGDGIGKEHHFSGEKLTTLLAVYKYRASTRRSTMMRGIYEVGGKGHSCGIYSFDPDHIHRLAMAAPVSRIMVRQPQSKANAGAFNNGMPMTSSLGAGTGAETSFRERAPQALHEHHLGLGADQGGQALGRGAVRRVLRPGNGSRSRAITT
jgi:sulfoacetaldehyde dehydrogenase